MIQSAVVGSCTTCLGGNHKSSCVGERGNKLLAANLCLLPHLLTSPWLFSIVTKSVFFAALLHEMRQRPRRHFSKPRHNPSSARILLKSLQKQGGEEQKGARLIKGEKKRMIFPPPPSFLLPFFLFRCGEQSVEKEKAKEEDMSLPPSFSIVSIQANHQLPSSTYFTFSLLMESIRFFLSPDRRREGRKRRRRKLGKECSGNSAYQLP